MRRFARYVMFLVPLAAVGCGGIKQSAERKKAQNDLKELGIAYITYQDTNQKPPKSLDELVAFAQKSGSPLSSGVIRLSVVWGAGMAGLCRDGAASEVVIASAPASGGLVPVLMADGSVRTMNQKEYDGAKKATPLNR